MENKCRILSFFVAVLLIQFHARAQSVNGFLNTGGIYTVSKAFTGTNKGDTITIERINDKAKPGDLLFEKGTIQIFKKDGNGRKTLGIWSTPKNGHIIFKTNKTYHLRLIKITGNKSLKMLLYNITN